MTNKDYVFKLLKGSPFNKKVKNIAKSFSNIVPYMKGELLECLVVDSIYPFIEGYKSGSAEKQRDFSIIKVDGSPPLRISMKSGSIVQTTNPQLRFNGSMMCNEEKFKTFSDRLNYMNEKLVDGILSCIFFHDTTTHKIKRCEFRYIDPKIFGIYHEKDFIKPQKTYIHVNEKNGIKTTIQPSIGYKIWYNIPLPILKNSMLSLDF